MKLLYNVIIYTIITGFLVFLLIYEKRIGAKIKEYRVVVSEKISNFFKITEPEKRKNIRLTVDVVETLTSAIVLVLIIQHFYLGNFVVPTGSMEQTIMPKDRLLGDMVSYRLFTKPKRGDIIVFKEPSENKQLYTKRLIGLPGDRIKIAEDGTLYVNGKSVKEGKLNREYSQRGFMGDKEWVVPKKGDVVQVIGAQIITDNSEDVKQVDIETLQSMIAKSDEKVKEATLINYARFLLNGKYETGPILDFKYDEKMRDALIHGQKVVLTEDFYMALGDNTNNSFDSRYWGFVSEERLKGKPIFRFWPIFRKIDVDTGKYVEKDNTGKYVDGNGNIAKRTKLKFNIGVLH